MRHARGSTWAVLALVTACHRDPSPRIPLEAIERCEDGTEQALRERTVARALRDYHLACSGLFFETRCANAFALAAKMSREDGDRATLDACRADYCQLPLLGRPEACNANFAATAESTPRALEELEIAIIAYDARGYAPRVNEDRLGFALGLIKKWGNK